MKLPHFSCVSALAVLCVLSCVTAVQSQDDGNGDGDTTGGITIDAKGVVSLDRRRDPSGALNRQRSAAYANEHLDADLQSYCDLRLVSLPSLERAYAEALETGGALPPEVEYLAGLQRIDFVFVDPDKHDVVLAGPAEGFAPDHMGRMRGLTTGRPPISLPHLIVAMRSVMRGEDTIGCSIDPEQGRLAELQRWVQANSTPTSSSGAKRRYSKMADILGLEQISVWGVPADTQFAHVLVEADFRMKRIALGAEPSGVRGIKSHLSMLNPDGNSMQRWWFAPLYDPIRVSEDGNAFQITGQRVQLMAQEENVTAKGGRKNSPFTRASTQQFAQQFTEHFPELAEKNPVFAQLQNLFDLAVVAALLRNDGVLERTGWRADVFLDRATVATYAVPRHVSSTAVTRPARNGTMLGLIGGVVLNTRTIVNGTEERVADPSLTTQQTRIRDLPPPSNGNAWWRD